MLIAIHPTTYRSGGFLAHGALKRLGSEEDRDEDAINEAKEMINKLRTTLLN